MRFLTYLLDALFPPRETDLLVRAEQLSFLLEKMRVTLCMRGGLLFASPFLYRDKRIEALMLESKFHNNKKAHMLLGQTLRVCILQLHSRWFPDSREIVLVPVPLSSRRRRERGYNQVEKIGRFAVTDELGHIAIHQNPTILRRIRHTKPQTSLSAQERRRNVRDAFSARPADETYLYIVFDDVCSTGATLFAAEKALREAGARQIYVISLAH